MLASTGLEDGTEIHKMVYVLPSKGKERVNMRRCGIYSVKNDFFKYFLF
jgi:hypothetical protein